MVRVSFYCIAWLLGNMIYSCFSQRVEMQDRNRFPDSVPCTKEKPFKMYSDGKDLTVSLMDLEGGWTLDKTPHTQVCRVRLLQQGKRVYSLELGQKILNHKIAVSCPGNIKEWHTALSTAKPRYDRVFEDHLERLL